MTRMVVACWPWELVMVAELVMAGELVMVAMLVAGILVHQTSEDLGSAGLKPALSWRRVAGDPFQSHYLRWIETREK